MKSIVGLLALTVVAWGQTPAYTTIRETLPPGTTGQPVNGTLNIAWAAFTYNGASVPPSPPGGLNFAILNGAVNVRLAATDHAMACPTNCPAYQIAVNIAGNQVATYWSVPTLPSAQCASASYCTVKEVTGALPTGPSLLVSPGQVSTGASSSGQVLCNLSGITGWCSISLAMLNTAGASVGQTICMTSSGWVAGSCGVSGVLPWSLLSSGQWSGLTSAQWNGMGS